METHPTIQQERSGPLQEAGTNLPMAHHKPMGSKARSTKLPRVQTSGWGEVGQGHLILGRWALSLAISTYGHVGTGAEPWVPGLKRNVTCCASGLALEAAARDSPNTCCWEGTGVKATHWD